MQRWANIEVDSYSSPILIAMQWNEYGAEWKARKYDSEGNIIYTIGKDDNNINSDQSLLSSESRESAGDSDGGQDLYIEKMLCFRLSPGKTPETQTGDNYILRRGSAFKTPHYRKF
ncbi:MAG: hypothetical protein IPM38_11350 [Ignavibacteria bacterium]|nr:hypothetical protein [Ignavibacteria bacterium]